MKTICTFSVIVGLVGVGFSSVTYAHSKQVHVNISLAAVLYLGQPDVDPKRPDLEMMKETLPFGAKDEDGFFVPYPFGRFLFHFFPALSFDDLDLKVSSSCRSLDWGFGALSQNSGIPCEQTIGDVSLTRTNNFRWQDATAMQMADPVTGSPTAEGWRTVGYVVHLLEDLTSPAHTRNDPHPCVLGDYCDEYERYNGKLNNGDGAAPNLPSQGSLLGAPDPALLTDPQSFFPQLQSFVERHFFSSGTVFDPFQPLPQPAVIDQDDQYFYTDCLGPKDPGCGPAAVDAPLHGNSLRKLAAKGAKYKLVLEETGIEDRTLAQIDSVIAGEQFAELGPITVEYVASFLKLYAPKLTVSTDGTPGSSISSSPSGITTCGATSCSAVFVSGTDVQITAQVPAGYTVSWQGACSGNTPTVTLLHLASDQNCIATFTSLTPNCPTQTICGTITDDETGLIPLHGMPVILRSAAGNILQQFNTGNDGKYAFGALNAATYIVDVEAGLVAVPSQAHVMTGGQPTNFTVRRVPASVTVTGPDSTFVLFTQAPVIGSPPCGGPGCPVTISGSTINSHATLQVPNGTWWLTCYVFPGFVKTSNEQLVLTAQESLSTPCPPKM